MGREWGGAGLSWVGWGEVGVWWGWGVVGLEPGGVGMGGVEEIGLARVGQLTNTVPL